MTIAVIGHSGSGKSAFINAIRNIMDWTSEDAAKVGIVEPTTKITKYPHPRYTNLVYCDLPGVNTPNFPRELYLDKINIETYDFFVLVSSTRFTDDDRWLAKELEHRRKPFYFVRTKIDVDVRINYQLTQKSKDETLNEIRNECQRNLLQQKSTCPKVFLISSCNPMDFDFPELQNQMIHDAPTEKRKALIATIDILLMQLQQYCVCE